MEEDASGYFQTNHGMPNIQTKFKKDEDIMQKPSLIIYDFHCLLY